VDYRLMRQNPVTILLNRKLDNATVLVIGLNGQVHQRKSLTGNEVQLDLSNLDSGLYICKVYGSNGLSAHTRVILTK
jgi:hypothetical protein